jgi:hypothetical protein
MSPELKNQLKKIHGLEAEKSKLWKDLEMSLKLDSLPQNLFKHGKIKVQWLPNGTAKVDRNGVDSVVLSHSHVKYLRTK